MKTVCFFLQKLKMLFDPPQRFFRYLICGCGAACINYSCFLLFCRVCKLHFSLSMFLAVAVTWIYSFVVNKFFVFQKKDSKTLRESILFLIQQLVLFSMANVIMWICVSCLKIHEALAWLIMSGTVFLFNYAGMKFIIWSDRKKQHPQEKRKY